MNEEVYNVDATPDVTITEIEASVDPELELRKQAMEYAIRSALDLRIGNGSELRQLAGTIYEFLQTGTKY